MTIPEDRILEIEGEKLVTPTTFAYYVNKSPTAIYHLVKNGNRYRKMRSRKIGKHLWIYLSEITEYPFTESGVNGKKYHYDENCQVVETHG